MSSPTEAEFRHALGMRRSVRIAVTTADGTVSEHALNRPCAIIGRSPESHVPIPDETVSYRHVYLQAIGDRLLCVDLFSPNGIRWEDGGASPWASPQRGLRIGACRVRLMEDGWPPADNSIPSPLDFKPREGGMHEYGLLPEVEVELLNVPHAGMTWPINRVITLVGRDDRCRVTCGDESVSKVHCSLVLLPSGLWVVDLLGKGGTRVDGVAQSMCRLSNGAELQIGRYRMQVHYRTAPASAPPATIERVAFLTKLHRIFQVSWDGDTLIVTPQGRSREFRYQDIQVEANAIISVLRTHGFRNLLVDFSSVKLTGSLIVDSVTQFCRVTQGMAAICGCSAEQLSALKDLNLLSLWPCYPTREAALRTIRAASAAAAGSGSGSGIVAAAPQAAPPAGQD